MAGLERPSFLFFNIVVGGGVGVGGSGSGRCVCVCERERERDRQTDRERETERERAHTLCTNYSRGNFVNLVKNKPMKIS